MSCRNLALVIVANELVEALQHAPGGGQGWVQLDGALVRLDRSGCILDGHVAVAALLVEQAYPWMVALQFLKCREGIRDAPRLTLSKRKQIQDVSVLRYP